MNQNGLNSVSGEVRLTPDWQTEPSAVAPDQLPTSRLVGRGWPGATALGSVRGEKSNCSIVWHTDRSLTRFELDQQPRCKNVNYSFTIAF
ncbi:MAG TPA: hypothetical protein VGC73_14125, partial [Pyrinomonadaceae bacterium]